MGIRELRARRGRAGVPRLAARSRPDSRSTPARRRARGAGTETRSASCAADRHRRRRSRCICSPATGAISRFAWRVLQFAFVFLLVVLALYVLERLVLVV